MGDAIAEAIRESEELWAFACIRHAAILNGSGLPDRSADVAINEGQLDVAKQYAKRCHQALLQTSDEVAKKDLLDLVIERWPQVSE